jgi:hypothetical protein
MNRSISVDVDLIAQIIGLPTNGEKPEHCLVDKTNEKGLA